MSAVGPELPPHLLAKRKRKQGEESKDEAATASGAKSPDDGEKRRRVIGPAMPPAPLDERPVEPVATQEEESDDDDGFGPVLPTSGTDKSAATNEDDDNTQDGSAGRPSASEKLQRDDWMMMPPKQDDLAARMDPTKQRPRGFNTGKGAKGPNMREEDNSAWNETPEQKRKRLQDEMMGVTKPASPGPQKVGRPAKSAREEAEAAKTREQVEKARGPSLMDQHAGSKGKDVDDDPSKRAFDREKDMGSGMRIGHAQRKDLLNKAAGFSSKFSGGSYL